MGGKSGKPTIGYWYDMDVLATACLKIDEVVEFKFSDRSAWTGSVTESGTIAIYKDDLFGGEEREGGVFGQVDIMFGESDQPVNEFLGSSMRASGIAGPVPAYRNSVNFFFRGVTAADPEFDPSGVFTGVAAAPPPSTVPSFTAKSKSQPRAFRWSAMNPYFKPFKIKARRYTKDWHPEIAKILRDEVSPDEQIAQHTDVWKYQAVSAMAGGSSGIPAEYINPSYDDSAWPVGNGGFGTSTAGATTGTSISPDAGKGIWLRKTITKSEVGDGRDVIVTIYHDDGTWCWWNGAAMTTVSMGVWNKSQVTIPASIVNSYNTLVIQVIDTIPSGFATNIFAGADIRSTQSSVGGDMNPAHIIRECLTDTDWGLGWPTSDVDDASFYAAAQTLHSESFGLSFKWSQQMSIEDFIMMVLRHINGVVYQDRQTGKMKLSLIRNDYLIGDLLELNPSNSNLESLGIAANGETVNIVNLTYSKVDGGVDTITVQDIGSIESHGNIPQDVEMLGIRNPHLAARVAQRELESRVAPIAKVVINTNRVGFNLHEGGLFKLNWPDQGIAAMPCRIATIDLGQLTDNQIRIEAVQDVFGLPQTSYVTPQISNWVDPTKDPEPSPNRLITETPYYDIVRSLSASDLDYLDATDCYIDVLATEPSAGALDYNLWSASGSAELVNRATGTHAVVTTLTAVTPKSEASVLEVANANVIAYAIETENAYVIIDGEYAKITDYDAGANTITVDRGVLDTVPKEHAIGTPVILVDASAGQDQIAYLPSEVVSVKVQTRTARGMLPIGFAPIDTYTINQRQARPYPPGKLRVNGLVYPTTIGPTDGLSLTWAHRNRLTQTAAMIAQSESSITPEVGTSYNLRVFNQSLSLLREETGLTDVAFDYTTTMEAADAGAGPSGVEEPFWQQTKLLLNFNGADNSTTFLDSSGEYADVFGNAKISTTESVFGGSSGYFDGAGDYISVPSSVDLDLGSTYTVECWVRPASLSNNFGIVHRGYYNTSGQTWTGLTFSIRWLTTNVLRVYFYGISFATEQYIDISAALTVNAWTHIAMVRNGSTGAVFINGVSAGTISGLNTPAVSSQTLRVGVWDYSANIEYFNGYIDDLRITKGTVRYTTAFTPPTQQFARRVKDSNFADNKLLLIFENDDNSGAIRDSSDLDLQVSNFGTTRLATDQSKFGSSSLILERSVSNADFIWVPFNSEHTGVSDITIDAWIRPIETVGTWLHTIASRGVPATSPRIGWNFYIDTDGKLVLTCYDSAGSASVYIKGSTVISINTWHHVAFCKSGTTWYLFLNGVSQGSVTESAAISVGGQELCIGRDQFAGASGDFYGHIDEFRIRSGAHYTSGFSVPTASAYPEDAYWANTPLLMNFNAANGSTEFENNGNINNVAVVVGNAKLSTTQFKYGVSSGYFDGTGDMVRFPHVDGRYALLADFTIECWVKATAGGSARYIALKASSASVTFPHWALVMGSTGLIECQLGRAQIPQSANFVTSTTAITFGEWVHIAFVRVGSVLKLFLNGTQTGGDVNVTITPLDSGSTGVDIGSYLGADPSLSWLGYIDDLRITKAARYTSNFTPPTRELSRYLPALNSQLTFELESERDGLVSWQKHRHTVTRA